MAMLAGLPADANPFAFISQLQSPRFLPKLSTSAVTTLVAFLVFHILVAAFSLVILVLPHIGKGKRGPWLVRKIYIQADSGEKLPGFRHDSSIYLGADKDEFVGRIRAAFSIHTFPLQQQDLHNHFKQLELA
ncbi:hypothetical protein PCASD_22356 [Puccinia coronata f. sp. avenae]|uniref:Uncharacterized protein n=1 Tax=Puccinia coronata f. sp. avenae TaxID=200324 RepID=A0A2N5SC82_9BASI|nr:hypothetical protein PCASD_22356 [Puccinia coronata f. sp. avenae]